MIPPEMLKMIAGMGGATRIAMTEEERAEVVKAYPARYYASFDLKADQPTRVTGWYDTWSMSSVASVPPAKDMIAMSQKQWDERKHNGMGVSGDRLIEYTPQSSLTLQEKATMLLPNVLTYVTHNYTVLNEPTPDAWVAYIKALRAIVKGTDTESTELPEAPPEE